MQTGFGIHHRLESCDTLFTLCCFKRLQAVVARLVATALVPAKLSRHDGFLLEQSLALSEVTRGNQTSAFAATDIRL